MYNEVMPFDTARDSRVVVDQLLTDVARHDARAFLELYQATIHRVHARIRRVLLDPTHSDDVTQDVYFEIWRTADRFDPELSPGITWMLRLAHARAVDRVRRLESARRRDADHYSTPGEHQRDLFAESDDRISAVQQIHAELPRLTPLQRQALSMVYLEGHTNTAAADKLGISAAAFKSRLHDGVLALRHALVSA